MAGALPSGVRGGVHSGRRAVAPPAVAIFARAAVPGKVKTRLIPMLGGAGAAGLQAAFLQDALRKVQRTAGRATRYLFLHGRGPLRRPAGFALLRQRGTNLGERLGHAFARLLRKHPSAIILGTDSPLLTPRVLRAALRELRVCDAVLGPCPDGGYYLVGLRRYDRGLFRQIRWGTRFAFADTLRNLLRRDYSCSILESCPDVDLPRDVAGLSWYLDRHAAARRLAPATWRFLHNTSHLSAA
jgi:rSAM/selenodomain-associated transferase 1